MTNSVIDYRHAREISDIDFVAAVRKVGLRDDGTGWANWWDVCRALAGYWPDQDYPDGGIRGVPWKVVLAKFRRLKGRGLLEGCDCGCRGDFELTPLGMQLLDAALES